MNIKKKCHAISAPTGQPASTSVTPRGPLWLNIDLGYWGFHTIYTHILLFMFVSRALQPFLVVTSAWMAYVRVIISSQARTSADSLINSKICWHGWRVTSPVIRFLNHWCALSKTPDFTTPFTSSAQETVWGRERGKAIHESRYMAIKGNWTPTRRMFFFFLYQANNWKRGVMAFTKPYCAEINRIPEQTEREFWLYTSIFIRFILSFII